MKKGDEVIYVSGRHGSGSNNPLHSKYPDVVGKITGYDSLGWLNVKWSNGTWNAYQEKDLRIKSGFKNKLKDKFNV